MATLRFVEESEAKEEVQDLYRKIKAGFGAGQVPNVYKVLANNPRILEAAVENRRRIMDEGELDSKLKEWLAWATVTLANNAFGIKIHTARLKKLGVSSAEILEALAVLQYFTGISTLINGLAMAEDVPPNVLEYLRQTP
ncbi:MAG: carboxymuconolactone decarboxylase family protein [candidate division NC10 bacterium]|nr:carboxymuconolactone decarboxylase family protein [candidate division NC10 bacterium]